MFAVGRPVYCQVSLAGCNEDIDFYYIRLVMVTPCHGACTANFTADNLVFFLTNRIFFAVAAGAFLMRNEKRG